MSTYVPPELEQWCRMYPYHDRQPWLVDAAREAEAKRRRRKRKAKRFP